VFNGVFLIGLRKIIKMVRGFWIGLMMFCFAIQASAIQAVVSHAVFSNGGMNAYAEIYWQIDPLSLHFTKTKNNTWQTEIKTEMKIKNETGIITTEQYLLKTPASGSIAIAEAASIIDMRKYALPSGKIVFVLKLTDVADTNQHFVFIDSFSVPEQNGVFYSDIQLLDTSYYSAAGGVFKKNNRQQIPLCANFLDENRTLLHYYGELYNVNIVAKESYPLIQKVFINKQENGGPVLNLLKTDTIHNADMQLLTGDFDISELGSGNYNVNYNLIDKDNVVIATKTLFFQRYKSKPKDRGIEKASAKSDSAFQQINVIDISKSFVMRYNLTELKAILKMLLPMSTPMNVQTIKSFLKNPDEGYMRYFIYNYFADINKKAPDAAWKIFSNRVREVNKQFGTVSQAGYETDRGYIYLKYGAPDEIVTVENERGALPYEIWQYNNINNQYKNAVFLFYRSTEMITGFRLLHSTVSTEMRNTAWRNMLYINGASSGDLNSRAEQYIGNR